MSKNSKSIAVNGMLPIISPCARLPLAVAALLLSAQAQAFLPTPLSVVTTGKLGNTTNPALTSSPIIKRTIDDGINDTQNAQSTQSANAEQLLTTWRQKVKADNLAQHTTWRRLLYFIDDEKSIFSKGENKSLVDDSSFFLSAHGQQDSGAELDAMLVALSEQLTTSANSGTNNTSMSAQANNSAALCRFPARVQWLTDTLNIDKTRVQVACPEFDDWMATLAPEQLSVMFAQEYLDNPISAFGHTLLRIDSPTSAADFTQIHHAYALNDTVDGDTADSFLIYAVKAMSGGYDNSIEIDPYPKKLADYLKDDERDTWTYQLDLTPTEVRQIMAHVWETKDLDIPYYFATDNCASEILRLIDVVRPKMHLLSQLPYVVIPSDVVNLLDDEKMLVSTRYTPADSTVRQAQLNKARQAAKLSQQSLDNQEKLGYQGIDKDAEKQIKSAVSNPASSMSEDKQRLQPLAIAVSNNNPLDRHPLQRGQIGIGHRGDNSYIDVGLRAGFHDILDRPAGFKQFFNLEGIDATLRFYDDDKDNKQPSSVVLQNFTLIRGRSFNPVNSAQKGKTWGANIEATRISDGSQQEGTDHLVGSTTLEYGKSWAFGTPRTGPSGSVTGEMPPQLCYTLATGAVQAGRGINKGYRVGAGLNAGCLYQINNQLRAQAELQLPYWYHGSSDELDVRGHYWQPITTLGLQYDIDKKQALRLNASYDWQDRVDANDDVKLAYMRYF
ncbi:DUF4105 domain-containing protein [Psychrobacter frigidicola]|uniref:Lnb N-terminal periplasmic domain-containing protein n=1 Tax=Psychrobacter frigidicola TaxID=45611 RepID=UPI00191A169C|nr:DUF4105 domain-containing protein [Psychrobacter frigidicola]